MDRGKQVILDSIDQFNLWRDSLSTGNFYSYLGEQFEEVDRSKVIIDAHRFPGVVVVEVSDPAIYRALRRKEQSLGFYQPLLGKGGFAGRILVINSSLADQDTPRHEYQHFIFQQGLQAVEFQPEVSTKKILKSKQEKKDQSDAQKKKIFTAHDQAQSKINLAGAGKQIGSIVPNYREIATDYHKTQKPLPSLNFAIESQLRTYPEGYIRNAFIKFRNEFMAYATGGDKEIAFSTYFGDTLDMAQTDPYYETFLEECNLLRGMLALARKKRMSRRQIGFLVGASRNMQQAAKFVFLELQLAEIEAAHNRSSAIIIRPETRITIYQRDRNDSSLVEKI